MAEGDGDPPEGTVVSLGSINVDLVKSVSTAELAALEDRFEWFPRTGETVRLDHGATPFGDDVDTIRHGGKGANQAAAAAHAGAAVTMCGKVGEDHETVGVLAALRAAGVDTTPVAVGPEPTGRAVVFVDPDGDNRIVVTAGANGTVDWSYIKARLEAVRAADCLLLQNEIPADPVVDLLEHLDGDPDRPTVILDPAPPDGVAGLLACAAVDYVTPNESEYRALGSALEAFDGIVIRKRGGEDVIVEGPQSFTVTPPAVEVVETTGAGDVMNGFLAAQLAQGTGLRPAVEIAVVAGSLSTRAPGARDGQPTLTEVRAFRDAGDTEQ